MTGQVVERVHTREGEGGAPKVDGLQDEVREAENLLYSLNSIIERNKKMDFLRPLLTTAICIEKRIHKN